MKQLVQELILNAWRKKNLFFHVVLIPLSWFFGFVIAMRRACYQCGLLRSTALTVPVIVVGNINMGGSGKTPVVIWLVEQLKQQGYQPAVISRGVGARTKVPTSVTANSRAMQVGDEPLLIAKRCDCPVWVGTDRVQVGIALLSAHPECDVIVSDDGLQHYRLKRDIELVVADEQTTNSARCLPAGPLREPISRLHCVDAIICHGENTIPQTHKMQLVGETFYNLMHPERRATAADFKRKSIQAIAGIGRPQRFFEHLKSLELTFVGVAFADHYAFNAEELASFDSDIVIMTEKDAVKCQPFAKAHYWVLPVEAKIDATLLPMVVKKLQNRKS
ncbi:MAG: tetraacyldisaccharide 4'-kinase [Methylophilaceae bacterium]